MRFGAVLVLTFFVELAAAETTLFVFEVRAIVWIYGR